MQDNFKEMIEDRGITINEGSDQQELIKQLHEKGLFGGSGGVMNRKQRRDSVYGVPLSGGDHSNKQKASTKKKEKNRAKKKANKKR